MKGTTYQRLGDHAESIGETRSGLVEKWVTEELDAKGVPHPDTIEPPTPRVKPSEEPIDEEMSKIQSQHFTF